MMWGIALGAAALVCTALGTVAYRALAVKRGIVANPNFRTLHERPMPRGGGIVFAIVFLGAAAVLWRAGFIDDGLVAETSERFGQRARHRPDRRDEHDSPARHSHVPSLVAARGHRHTPAA